MTLFRNISSIKPIRYFPIQVILGLILIGSVACNRSTQKTILIKTDQVAVRH